MLKFSLLAVVALASATLQAQDWPKGIDPSSLLLNTETEPDLQAPGFVDLFNGKDLDGWKVLGGQMPFTVENGEIVGTCIPGVKPNAFLCTEETFENFIFTVEFKWDVLGNSGVMFRADAHPADQNGIRRVFGYQSEMDPTDRGWTGGIYGEAMKGWLYPLSLDIGHHAARGAVAKRKEWNRMTIYASGNTTRTWVNGVPCSYLIDDLRQNGFIGLQVHQGKSEGQIRWRNVKLKEIPAETPWTNLLANDTLDQWTRFDGEPVSEDWGLEKGILTRTGEKPGDIVTKQSYKDFELRFDWKISDAGNSGIKYRTQARYGLEYQILDDLRHHDNEKANHLAAGLYELKATANDKPIRPVGSWNQGRIHVQGNTFTHYLNGEKVVEIEYGSDEWNQAFAQSKYAKREGFGSWTGPILLQDHFDEVSFRNLRIREL